MSRIKNTVQTKYFTVDLPCTMLVSDDGNNKEIKE